MKFYFINVALELKNREKEIPRSQFTEELIKNLIYLKKFSFYPQENLSNSKLYKTPDQAFKQLSNVESTNGKIIGIAKVNLASTSDDNYLLVHDIFVIKGVAKDGWNIVRSFQKPFLLKNSKKTDFAWALIEEKSERDSVIDQLFFSTNEMERLNLTQDTLRCMLHTRLHSYTKDEFTLSLAAGQDHAITIVNSKFLIGIGRNEDGQAGSKPARLEMISPILIDTTSLLKDGEKLIQAAAGRNHTLVLTNNNRLIVCGSNYSGQLGLGKHGFRHADLEALDLSSILESGENIKSVYAARHQSCLLTSHNRLLVAGDNYHGQLGIGDNVKKKDRFVPIKLALSNNETIDHVTLGDGVTLVYTNKERLLICGAVRYIRRLDFFKSSDSAAFILHPIEKDLQPNEKIMSISTGSNDTFIITTQGRVLVTSGHDYYEPGIATNYINNFIPIPIPLLPNEAPIQVAASYDHFFILTNQNRVFATGSNEQGKLGLGSKDSTKDLTELNISHLFKPDEQIKEIAACGLITVMITTHNRMFGCGNLKGFYKATERLEPIDLSPIFKQIKKIKPVIEESMMPTL